MKNLVQRIRGPAASIGLRCRVHSASSFYSWLQTTKLSLIHLSQDTTVTQSRSPCFYPRPFPPGTVSGAISKCVGSVHTWRQPGVPRSMLSWSQSYSLLDLALGSVTRQLFWEKHEKWFSSLLIYHQHSFLISAVFPGAISFFFFSTSLPAPGAISMKFLKAVEVHY